MPLSPSSITIASFMWTWKIGPKLADELRRVDALPNQVARVELKPNSAGGDEHLQSPLGRVEVESDLGQVDLQQQY